MGLAERFKDKLDKKDIFTTKQETNSENITKSQFVSSPITIQPKHIHTELTEPVDSISELSSISSDKFEDLESEIISKIRKTPYWEDFSFDRQRKMISSYFDKKTLSGRYSYIKKNPQDKDNFIQNILALANNR